MFTILPMSEESSASRGYPAVTRKISRIRPAMVNGVARKSGPAYAAQNG